jgi:hypothetical protein
VVEEQGVPFLFDEKTAYLVGELVVDWDEDEGVDVYDESLGRPNC